MVECPETVLVCGWKQAAVIFFVYMQIVIDIEWLILRPPDAVLNEDDQWVCKQDFEANVKVSFIWQS